MKDCIFCDKDFHGKEDIIYENLFWKAVYDGYPVVKGHTLIIPKKHVGSIFKLGFELLFLPIVFKKVKKILNSRFHPNGYNIGINDGKAAGQTIHHLHIHFIPRYDNDCGLPCGVRNVFPPILADYKKYF